MFCLSLPLCYELTIRPNLNPGPIAAVSLPSPSSLICSALPPPLIFVFCREREDFDALRARREEAERRDAAAEEELREARRQMRVRARPVPASVYKPSFDVERSTKPRQSPSPSPAPCRSRYFSAHLLCRPSRFGPFLISCTGVGLDE